MRIGTFDLGLFQPESNLQTAIAAGLLTTGTLLADAAGASPAGAFGTGISLLATGWLIRQVRTSWKRDNCILESDLLDIADDTSAASSDITDVLANYGLPDARLHKAIPGPVLTRHLVSLQPGTKLSSIPKADDLALGLGVPSVSVSLSGQRNTIALDVPREDRQTVPFADLLQSTQWASREGKLPCMPAVDVTGNPVIFDLQTAPHLIVGGTTGQGKSVFMNALLLSLMQSGADFRLMIGDGKGEDFAPFYGNSRHLLTAADVTALETEVDGIAHQVMWLATEMDNRFKTGYKPYPIIMLIDELADVVLQDDSGDIVKALVRLAQKGRSAGIHLVIGTQYPSASTLPDLLRANIPSRAGMTVAKDYESRVVLGETGCEKLLSKGDCLLKLVGTTPQRIHGALITETDIKRYMK